LVRSVSSGVIFEEVTGDWAIRLEFSGSDCQLLIIKVGDRRFTFA
jgi:hypothetical protein